MVKLDPFLGALERCRPGDVGIREWSVYATERRRLSLGIKDREAGNAHTPLAIAEGCGARYLVIWEDGLVSRGSLERRQLEHEAEQAVEQARSAAYDDPDAAQVLGPAPLPEVELHAAAAAEMARGDTGLLSRRLATVRQRIDKHGFRTWSGSFSAAEGEARLVTSAGLDVGGRGTSAGWFVTIQGEVGDGFSSRSPEPEQAFEDRLDRLLIWVGELQRPAESMSGGTRPVLLHPSVVEEYALGTLMHNLDGSAVANEEGHFRKEHFGSSEPQLREDLTLRLDPLQPLKSGSYRFTVEGVPAARCVYLEQGRLVRPVLDLKYARRLGLKPTPVPYSMDVLHFEGPQPLNLDQALAEAAGGLLVLSVLGVHTQDAASGDFSLSAPQTLAIGPAGYAGRLRCTISGNLFSLLQSDELKLVEFDGDHTPGLLFPCRVDPK